VLLHVTLKCLFKRSLLSAFVASSCMYRIVYSYFLMNPEGLIKQGSLNSPESNISNKPIKNEAFYFCILGERQQGVSRAHSTLILFTF